MPRRGMAAIALAIACGTAAAGEFVNIVVGPSAVTEGLPATFDVVILPASDATIAVSEVRIAFGPVFERHTLARHLRGAWGEPATEGAVTVDLEVSEGDIGPVARAPMPPVRVPCGPDAFVTWRLLPPGKELRFSLRVVPLAGRPPEVRVEVDCVPLEALTAVESAHPVLYPKGSANASVVLGDAQPGAFPGPGAASVCCQAWSPSAGEAEEILLDALVASALVPTTEKAAPAIEIKAAPVPSAQALDRAGLTLKDIVQAVWLAETETWVLETRNASVLAPKEGDTRKHKGRLAALAARMTEGGPVELSAPMDEALRGELEEAGVRTSEGKMLLVQARAQHLAAILDVLEKRGLVVDGQYVTEAPAEGPTPVTIEMEDGLPIPCIDCQVLRPGLADCPTCKGKGRTIRPCYVQAEGVYAEVARGQRAKVDDLVAKARALSGEESHAAWEAAAREMREALADLLLYGYKPSYEEWAAGWAGRDAVPSHPDLRAAFLDLLKAEIRFGILDAEGRLGAK